MAKAAAEGELRRWRAGYWAKAAAEATAEAEERIEAAARERQRIERELLAFDDAEYV